MDAAFYGAKRLTEHPCYLVVLKAIKIKNKWVPEDLRKVMDRVLNVLYAQIAFRRISNRSLVHVQ